METVDVLVYHKQKEQLFQSIDFESHLEPDVFVLLNRFWWVQMIILWLVSIVLLWKV